MYNDTSPATAARTEMLSVDSLRIDRKVQRPLVEGAWQRIAREYRSDGIGVFTGSRRDTGIVVCLDGQHRRAAMKSLGLGDQLVPVRVFEGLSVEQEADMFRLLNRARKISAIEDFTKGVLANDPECVDVNDICGRHGLTVRLGRGAGDVAAIGRVLGVYRGTGVRGDGPHPWALDWTLDTITTAWGHDTAGLDGVVIAGVGVVFLVHGEAVNRARLSTVLAKRKGGAANLIGQARSQQDYSGTTLPKTIAGLIVSSYNRGLRSGKLGPVA